MSAAMKPEPRVFVLYYPQGTSVYASSVEPPTASELKETENRIIARDLIKGTIESVEAGKSICIALPIREPEYDGTIQQWQLKEVQKINEEGYDKLRKVADLAAKLLMDQRVEVELETALHDAGYKLEKLT